LIVFVGCAFIQHLQIEARRDLLAGLPAQALSAYVLLALNQHVENLALIGGTPEVHRQLDERGDTNHLNLVGRRRIRRRPPAACLG
jgi:hypothetical protein